MGGPWSGGGGGGGYNGNGGGGGYNGYGGGGGAGGGGGYNGNGGSGRCFLIFFLLFLMNHNFYGISGMTCPPGQYPLQSTCVAVPAGSFSYDGQGFGSCPPGTFSSTGASVCTLCPVGKMTAVSGQTSCTSLSTSSNSGGACSWNNVTNVCYGKIHIIYIDLEFIFQ